MKWLSLLLLMLVAAQTQARDQKQVRLFRVGHPCPATGLTHGSCKGYVVDHIWPLCAKGGDIPKNMQWSKKDESLLKDKDELSLCSKIRAKKIGTYNNKYDLCLSLIPLQLPHLKKDLCVDIVNEAENN